MVIMDVIRDTRGGLKYLWNACRYLENDEKSVYTGGYGVNPYNLNTTYRQMVSVRQYYEKTSGNPLMHFMISFDETVQTEETAILLTQNLAAFFRTRYQVLYCVHEKHAIEVTYKNLTGQLGSRILYREDEVIIEMVSEHLPWSFDADGNDMRLVSEAYRINLSHLFDPYLAVHTSSIEPLPHQISAVYEEMLTRQPLHYVLADDPGAGKTIMTGFLLKELIVRGDLKRCLIVSPGSLSEQWQDELYSKFNLRFDILSNDRIESAVSGNVFAETNLCIARLDKLARNEGLQQKLKATEWDLIVVDEAHKMSASVWGGEVKYTQRYHLGQLLSGITRHFLLLTATPHNGKPEDFQLFLALIDQDRFEGAQRTAVLGAAKREIMKSTGGNPPELLDPFAGGGAIPLEAQRLGLVAHAHDLNPVAVMINKAMIEIPPRFAGRPPVNPDAKEHFASAGYVGAAGLAEDVRWYGEWMKQQAFQCIGHLYPQVDVPDELGGGKATVIA